MANPNRKVAASKVPRKKYFTPRFLDLAAVEMLLTITSRERGQPAARNSQIRIVRVAHSINPIRLNRKNE
ncbi:MAG: hypothetical protein R3B46_05200 [Phycisphaerales bacterium]